MTWSLATPMWVAPSSTSAERRSEHTDRRRVRPRVGRAAPLLAGSEVLPEQFVRPVDEMHAHPATVPTPISPLVSRSSASHADHLDTTCGPDSGGPTGGPEALRHRRDDVIGPVRHVLVRVLEDSATGVLQLVAPLRRRSGARSATSAPCAPIPRRRPSTTRTRSRRVRTSSRRGDGSPEYGASAAHRVASAVRSRVRASCAHRRRRATRPARGNPTDRIHADCPVARRAPLAM